ncbi:glycoside hydrolase family 75 protein [Streptomyces thermoalcalitolerans]|uniref:Secreted protein n=1 Tax=Streptomyces thermoalcalitolerans TaxID=65605 RepID=A0ABP3YX74_9ACTN
MRAKSLTLVAASSVLLAPTTLPAPAPVPTVSPRSRQESAPVARSDGTGPVRAADLLAVVRQCRPVSRGRYRLDAGAPPTVAVCGLDDAVFWKADMDIDCDGRPTVRCNRRTDPHFSPATAYRQSDGRRLDAERLPYVVLPAASRIWDHRAHGVGGGSVAAVVYQDRVEYAVVGDIGPREIIGEASYAVARRLGIPAHPSTGGVSSGVTYIVFKNSRIDAIEDHAAAVVTGERLARRLVNKGLERESDGAANGAVRENDGAAWENGGPVRGDGEPARESDEPAQGDGRTAQESDGTVRER